jgi:hypothetical protein
VLFGAASAARVIDSGMTSNPQYRSCPYRRESVALQGRARGNVKFVSAIVSGAK